VLDCTTCEVAYQVCDWSSYQASQVNIFLSSRWLRL